MFGLGIWELALIFGIMLLLFGARRLPDIAAGLGGAISSFKKSLKDGEEAGSTTIDANKQIDGDKGGEKHA